MMKRTRTGRFAALAPLALVVLVAALAPLVASPNVAHAQSATVLVKNTGQDAGSLRVQLVSAVAGATRGAQAFTTGADAGGYTLGSVGVWFRAFSISADDAAAQLAVTLNADAGGDDSGDPASSALCTLTHPATFSSNSVNTFDAPTTSPCPTLAASTTYHVVIQRMNPANGNVWLGTTDSDGEDTGGATGWSIANDLRYYEGGAWDSESAALRIEVNGPVAGNAAPSFDAGTATRTLPENSEAGVDVVGGVVAATDSDSGDTLTYSLTGTDAGSFEIDSSGQLKTKTGVTHDFNFEAAKKSYSVAVNVRDSKDADGNADAATDATIAVTIDLTNVDEAGTVTLPATIRGSTEATASVTDPDGAVSGESWQWALGDTATGAFTDIGGATDAAYTPVAADVGKYLWATVRYTDPEGSGKTASAVSDAVGAAPANLAPTFDDGAMTTRTVPENSGAGVDVVGGVIAATDGDSGDTLTYSLTGTDAARFEIDSDGQIKVKTGSTHTFNFESSKKSYSVTVTVRDSKDDDGVADAATDATIAVTIDLTNVDEDGTVTLPATFTGGTAATASVTDPDGTVSNPSWRWARGDTATGQFRNIGGAASATYTPVAADVGKYLRATVNYADPQGSGKTAFATSSSTVVASNAKPTFDEGTEADRTLPENSLHGASVVGGAITATDTDGDTLTYALSGTHARSFEIDATGQIKVKTGVVIPGFDFEGATTSYSVTVLVHDGKDAAGNNSNNDDDDIAVTISLTNVNEAPAITTTGTTFTTISKPEGTPTSDVLATYAATDPDAGATLTWTLSGGDAGEFTIVGGELKFSAVPDFESAADDNTNNAYSVTVNVRDSLNDAGNADTAVDDSIDVTVTVTNVDEAGTVTISGTEEGGETLTASVTDIDGTVSNVTWRWQREGSGGSFSNIGGATSSTYTTVAADVGKKLKAVASYTDPQGSGKSASAETGAIGSSNAEPTFSSMTATRTLPENSGLGVNVVGGVITASDSDGGDTLTYSLTGSHAGRFEVDSNGQIKTKSTGSPQTFNFEDMSNNSFSVTLNVRDSKDAAGDADTSTDDTITVTINLTNVNEAPVITSPPATRSIAENSTAVYTFAATDVDASPTLTWSVKTDDDGGKFDISTTGALSFKNAPDFETPTQSGGTNNDYVVTVKVTDAGSLSDTHTFTVTVTDVNETPSITSGPSTITKDENTATTEIIATYVATDPDATTGTMSWDLQGNDAPDFRITPTVNGTANLYFGDSTSSDAPDFENAADTGTNNVYDVTVRVRDNGSPQLQDTRDVDVTVEDVNETPVISGDSSPEFEEIEYDATSPDLTIGTYTYTDEDRNPADTITWGIRSSFADAAHFNIGSSTGVLSFNMRPDFENPFGADNQYLVEVQADDGQGGVGTFPVTVTVTNVDETPEITTDGTTHTAPSFMEIEYDATTADLVVADYDGRDEEGQTITWSTTGTDAGDFSIDSMTGVLSFAQRPNYEIPVDADTDNVYNVTVRARDTASNTRELEVIVTVTDVNERPDIDENFNAPQHYLEIEYDADTTVTGTLREVHMFTATDYDGDTIGWALGGTDAAHLDIDSGTGVLTFKQDSCTNDGPLPDFEEPCDDNADGSNTYSITVRAFDDATDKKTTEYAVVVTVTDVNEVPEFTGTPETAITLDEHDANDDYVVMDLADYDARDEEGGVTWSLTGTDRGDFAISADGVVTFAKMPNYEAPEDFGGDNGYAFNVVATDEESGSSRRTVSVAVTVTVGDVEEAGTLDVDSLTPVASETLTFTLTDPDGGIDTSTILWDIQSMATGESWETVSGVVDPLSATFPWTVSEGVTGKKLRAVVTYTDGRGSGKTAVSDETAAVTENPIVNAPPRFRGISIWSVEEGPAGKAVGAPITATDRDNDTLTYGIKDSLDSALFAIDPSTGQVRFAQALDFETKTGEFLFFTITLHDGRDADGSVEDTPEVDATRSAIVTILDAEEDGVVTLSAVEPEKNMPLNATLEDGDGGVSGEVWQWARSLNGQTGWSSISGGRVEQLHRQPRPMRASTSGPPSPTRTGGATARAPRRSRTSPSLTRTKTPPSRWRRKASGPSRRTPRRTRTSGRRWRRKTRRTTTLTYALSGMDAGAFTIVETTGQLRVKDALDFETTASYDVTIEVHDRLDTVGNASTTVDDTLAVTITVENVEEPGVVTLTTDTGTIQARVEVTAALSDDDGPTGVTWQWARSPDGSTDWVNIAGATFATYTPTLEEDAGNYLRARASYDDGHGSNKTAEAVSARVGDAPSLNSAPAFPATEDGQREVAENAADGTAVGAPVAATDLNAGDSAVNDPLVYALSGTDAASFTIDAGTGQIRVGQNVELDYEGKKTYQVSVEVSDGRDQYGDDDMDAIDATRDVTITVTNVNEAPEITTVSTTHTAVDVDETTATTTVIETYEASDVDANTTLSWSLEGVDGGEFTITKNAQGHGELRFAAEPNYETPVDDDANNDYDVTVKVRDNGIPGNGGTSNQLDDIVSVTITVRDVEEPGMVTLTTATGRVQARVEVTAALSDGDGPTGVSWQWARSPDGRTDWVDIAGATSAMYTPTLEEDRGNYLRARASYDDGRGTNKTAEKVSARVDDPPSVNSAPVFPATEDGQREVAENAVAGTAVGAPVGATDLNAGNAAVNDPLVYTLSGTDAASFTIDSDTGQLRVAQGVTLDYEGKRTYRAAVEVTDGADQNGDDDMDAIDARQNVTITVTNLNEAPEVRGDATVSYPEDANRAIATYMATDPERGTLAWSVSGADDTEFWISQRGQLHFRSPPSSETRMNYTVTVTATDDDANNALSDSLSVNVMVDDAEEVGTVTILPPRGWDGTAFRAVLTDGDGGITGETWQWQRSSNRSSWQDISGATLDSYTAGADDINNYLRVTVTYTDRRGSGKEASAAVVGRIEDSNDRPVANTVPEFTEDDDDTDAMRTTTRSVGQGTAAGRSVGAPVRATDEDPGDVLTYSLSGTDAGLFDIDPATGQIRTKVVLDYDPDGTNTHSVEVRVHDGYGPDHQTTAVGVDATITVTITVTAVAQRSSGDGSGGGGGGGGGFGPAPTAPRFVDGFRTERPLAVTARPGDAVGDPVSATHPNDDDVTYSLSGANAALFTVDGETGQIRLSEGARLEVGQTYTVNLTATDGRGTGAIIIVVIAVTEGVGDPYDLNRNGAIEKDEVLRAIADYFAGRIGKDEVLALVARYFAA